jgi:hypothetical protein
MKKAMIFILDDVSSPHKLSNFSYDDETIYISQLVVYLKKFSDKTEGDFLNLNLNYLQEQKKRYEGYDEIFIREKLFEFRKNNFPEEKLDESFKYPFMERRIEEEMESIPRIINNINNKIDRLNIRLNRLPKKEKLTKSIEEKCWFRVGIEFAKGTPQNLFKEYNHTEIAVQLFGDKKCRPYIGQTIANVKRTDKNIFSSESKVRYLIEYCKKNDIVICNDFNMSIKKWDYE